VRQAPRGACREPNSAQDNAFFFLGPCEGSMPVKGPWPPVEKHRSRDYLETISGTKKQPNNKEKHQKKEEKLKQLRNTYVSSFVFGFLIHPTNFRGSPYF